MKPIRGSLKQVRQERDIPSHSVQKYYLNKRLHEDFISLQERASSELSWLLIRTATKSLCISGPVTMETNMEVWGERERLKILQDPTELLEIYPKEFISTLKRSLPALTAGLLCSQVIEPSYVTIDRRNGYNVVHMNSGGDNECVKGNISFSLLCEPQICIHWYEVIWA